MWNRQWGQKTRMNPMSDDKTFQGLFWASHLRSNRETPWYTVAQVATYSGRHSARLDAERELPG